jgi:hypothetical protein
VLRVEAGLFYFNAQNVKNEVLEQARRQGDVELVIIDLSYVGEHRPGGSTDAQGT